MARAELDKQPADVRRMFDAVARRYDLTNDILSFGQDRRWRKEVLDAVDPAFGDRVPLHGDEQSNPQGVAARNAAVQQDQQLVRMIAEAKPDELIASMAWQGNPTRWCSLGNITAAMKVVDATPERTKVLNYLAAMDQQGMAMVSCIAAAVV